MQAIIKRPLLVLALAIVIGLLPNMTSAQTVNCIATGTAMDFGACISMIIPLALIGILFSFSLIGLSYMIGEVFDVGNLKGWYRTELREVAKSIIIIALIIAILVIVSSIAADLAGAPSSTQGSSAIYSNLAGTYNVIENSYLAPGLTQAADAYNALVGVSIGLGILKSISISTWVPIPLIPPVIVASLQFGSSASVYVSSILESTSAAPNLSFIKDVISIIVVPIYFAFQIQEYIIWEVIEVGMLVFIPIGIFLRAVPFLRGLGGTFIAIGISISLVYPTTLVALNMPITSYFESQIPLPSGCSLSSTNGVVSALFGVLCGLINPILQAGGGVSAGLDSITSIYPSVNLINAYTFQLIIQFILFIIDIIIVVSIANSIAGMLGGRIRLSIGKRLRLA